MKAPQSLNIGKYLPIITQLTYQKTWIFKSFQCDQEQKMGELKYIYKNTVVGL